MRWGILQQKGLIELFIVELGTIEKEAKILKYCEELGLKLNKFTESKRYIHYVIHDENHSGGLLNEE